MKTEEPHPPALARWIVRCLYPQRHREALIGDLLERFREERTNSWFWRQVVLAILIGYANELRLHSAEISLATLGTGLIWCFPWTGLFPIAEATTSTNWVAQARWLPVIEIVTAALVMPLFAALLRLWTALRWRNLFRVSITAATLFTAGDLATTWWCVGHPIMSRSYARWVVTLQLAWIFVALLCCAEMARRFPSSRNTTSV